MAGCWDNCLPGGFTVFQNKLYILGGFDTVTGGARDEPDLGVYSVAGGSGCRSQLFSLFRWVTYPPRPSAASSIRVGAAIFTAGVLTDTTNSFVYNPVANTIGTITAIPRATGETRALNFNGKMLVMGGGRTAPNPSNEVDAL